MKARNIVVRDRKFCWLRSHIHEQHGQTVYCAERVVVYAGSNKKGGLVVIFNNFDEQSWDVRRWNVDGSLDGLVFYGETIGEKRQAGSVNFNRPAVIAALIAYFLDHGWDPDSLKQTAIRHGMSLLNEMALPEETV